MLRRRLASKANESELFGRAVGASTDYLLAHSRQEDEHCSIEWQDKYFIYALS
jgi:hypothetical protein